MIRLSPLAFQKIVTAQSFKSWEVGFYGMTLENDVTRVVDVYMPKQKCNDGRNEFDDKDVGSYVGKYLKKGYTHRQLTAVWIHTHPGAGEPRPSKDDTDMFNTLCESGGNINIMVIATKDKIKAWVKCRIDGWPDVVESEEEVKVDWSLDSREKFTLKRWKKAHDNRVTELPAPVYNNSFSGNGPVNIHRNMGFNTSRQCHKCFGFKANVTDRICRNTGCDHKTNYCWDCYTSSDGLCISCRQKAIEETHKGPKEPTVQARADDRDVCPVFGDGRQCSDCNTIGCGTRKEEYVDIDNCEEDCSACLVEYCYRRSDIPDHFNCGIDGCDTCAEYHTCAFSACREAEDVDDYENHISETDYEEEEAEQGND